MSRPFLYIWIALTLGCSSPPEKLFELVSAEESGITFENNLEHSPEFNMYTYRNFYNGGGVGIGDINNDQLEDIFFCGNMVDNKLYLNKGDFKFDDISQKAGVRSESVWSTGVSMVDINADGWLDLYVCKSGRPGGEKRHNELFVNNGDLTFTEMAKEYGLADVGLSSHAAFFDYDKDGDLDCYLLNNSFRPVGGYDMQPGLRDIRDSLGGNKLYKNMMIEDDHHFKDVSEEAGIYGSAIGFGLGVTIGDINRDGWPDIFVSNDFFERDYLYINQQDGTFLEDILNQMPEISMGSMGADMADINNDGFPEIFVTEMLPRAEARYKTKMTFENWNKYQLNIDNGYHRQFTRNVLQLNNKNGTFSEIGRYANVQATDWSWSALMADFDNDGWRDIYISNGIYKDLLDQDYVNYHSSDPKIIQAIRQKDPNAILDLIDLIPSEPISNFVFRNEQDLTFSDVTQEWNLSALSFSNGAAYGDLDNDGDLDLVVNNCNMPSFLFRNRLSDLRSDGYLDIALRSWGANPFAIGAQVTVHVDSLTALYQELAPQRGFQSSVSYRMHFGLGKHTQVDSVVVVWPDLSRTMIENPAADQLVEIVRNKEENSPPQSKSKEKVAPYLLLTTMNSIDWQHQESRFVDFDRDRLLHQMFQQQDQA